MSTVTIVESIDCGVDSVDDLPQHIHIADSVKNERILNIVIKISRSNSNDHAAATSSFKALLKILPTLVLGSSVLNSKYLGTL